MLPGGGAEGAGLPLSASLSPLQAPGPFVAGVSFGIGRGAQPHVGEQVPELGVLSGPRVPQRVPPAEGREPRVGPFPQLPRTPGSA